MTKPVCIAASLFSLLLIAGTAYAEDLSAVYVQEGNKCYAVKNYDQAIVYYDAAAQVNPNNWQIYQSIGNCYYAKGWIQEALTSYQKALKFNPDNPQLSKFAKSLQARVDKLKKEAAQIPVYTGNRRKVFELRPGWGLAIDPNSGYDLGLGGVLSCFYVPQENTGIGLILQGYAFENTSAPVTTYLTQSLTQGNETITTKSSTANLELLLGLKYKLEAEEVKPYLVGGIGIADLMQRTVTTYSYQNGNPYNGPSPPSLSSGSSLLAAVLIGGGIDIPADKDLNLYVEVIINVVTDFNASAQYIPVEAGLSFGL
jgi:tetratricopeptide (TPR) repeat protein